MRTQKIGHLRDGQMITVRPDGFFDIGNRASLVPIRRREWDALSPGDRRRVRKALFRSGFRRIAHETVH